MIRGVGHPPGPARRPFPESLLKGAACVPASPRPFLGRARLRGRVDEPAPAPGSEFAALKSDNALGNFVRVPQRIEVWINVDPGQPDAALLRPARSISEVGFDEPELLVAAVASG